MKIVVLEGSPNKNGSTHILADCFRQGAEEAGHTHRIAQALRALTGGVPCDFAREIARLCPRAEVREPLGVLEDLGVLGDGGEALSEFPGRNGLPAPPAAYAGWSENL